jgi:hypothetical protein
MKRSWKHHGIIMKPIMESIMELSMALSWNYHGTYLELS